MGLHCFFLFSFTDAVLIPEILVNKDGEISSNTTTETSTNKHDVTGGIKFKINTAIEIVKNSSERIEVIICKMDSSAFRGICLGEMTTKTECTTIKCD